MKHPMQYHHTDQNGTLRFNENKIVSFLLEAGPFDMNALAGLPFDDDDRQQFAQLIGYSLDGFCELSYASMASIRHCDDCFRAREMGTGNEGAS